MDQPRKIGNAIATLIIICCFSPIRTSAVEDIFVEDQLPRVQLSEQDYAGSESDGAVEVEVVLYGRVLNDVYLRLNVLTLEDAAMKRNNSLSSFLSGLPFHAAQQDFVDYQAIDVFFPARSDVNLRRVAIPIVNDEINEATEYFLIVLESTSPYADIVGRSASIGKILDDDSMAIEFEQDQYEVREGQDITIKIVKKQKSELQYDVSIIVSLSGVILGKDVNLTSDDLQQSLVLPPSEQTVNISFTINDDLVPEQIEHFSLSMSYALHGSDQALSCIGCVSYADIKITDNDDVEIGFETAELEIKENAGEVSVCVVVTHPPPDSVMECFISAAAVTVNGSAGETEFTATAKELFFLNTLRKQCFNVVILDDKIAESTKHFSLNLISRSQDTLPQLRLGISSVTVTIVDDEIIAFEHDVYSVHEEDGYVDICILKIGEVKESLSAVMITVEHTAFSTDDYLSRTTNMTFESTGVNQFCFPIALVDDDIPEVHEVFNITVASGGIVKDTAMVVIIDGDVHADHETGCSVELFVITAVQERAQTEVVSNIQTVLPSLSIATPPINTTTTKDEVIRVLYDAVVEKLAVVKSNTTLNKFQEAITEITEAHQEACNGPADARPELEDVPSLVNRFSSVFRAHTSSTELREIYGKMLCLNDLTSSHGGRKKRQDPVEMCVCPVSGLYGGEIFEPCQFFKCLDDDFSSFGRSLFGFVIEDFNCLAFVVDTTGSMGGEIKETRRLMKSFISSEEDDPACYVVTPFNDHHYFREIGHPLSSLDYGPVTVFDTFSAADLVALHEYIDSDSLSPHSGGDCPEYGMNGLRETITESRLYGIDVMEGAKIILITDASAKDDSIADSVISLARAKNICIHFFLSENGCPGFGSYPRVAEATGGSVVQSSDAFTDLVVTSSRSTGDSTCVTLSGSRKRRQVDSTTTEYTPKQQCHTFRVSRLVSVMRVHIKTEQPRCTIIKADGTRITVNILGGYALHKETYPTSGEWSLCTDVGTVSILTDQQISIDTVVSYVKKDDTSPVGVVATTRIPPACTEGKIAVFTSKHEVISRLHLNVLNEEFEVTQHIPLNFCGGAFIGNATFPLGVVHYQLEGEDTTRNPFVYNIKKRHELKKSIRLKLSALSTPQEIDRGSFTTLSFEIENSDYYRVINLTLSVESHHGFINTISPSIVSINAGDTIVINVIVRASGSSLTGGSSYNIKVVDKTGCTGLSATQIVRIKELPTAAPDDCDCENGGTCVFLHRRGRVYERCSCPEGYGGRYCSTPY